MNVKPWYNYLKKKKDYGFMIPQDNMKNPSLRVQESTLTIL